jgi:hypothetical protein
MIVSGIGDGDAPHHCAPEVADLQNATVICNWQHRCQSRRTIRG